MCGCVCAQVEERLRFYEEGVAPRKNASVMEEAMASVKTQLADEDKADGGKKKKKVRGAGGRGRGTGRGGRSGRRQLGMDSNRPKGDVEGCRGGLWRVSLHRWSRMVPT